MVDSSSRSEGVQSFREEQPSSACTYAKGSTRQREWTEGWVAEQQTARAESSEDPALPMDVDASSDDPLPADSTP